MCFRLCGSLVGLLNLATVFLSIPIIGIGLWLANWADTDCEKFLQKPVIILGAALLLVSIVGFVGACCSISLLLWVYLLVVLLLILSLFCITVFTFIVTNKGAGEVLSGRGYKEYRLGDYSNWLQKRVNNTKNWDKIKSCLMESKVCSSFSDQYLNDTLEQFYSEHLSAVQSGCCKPPDACGFTYESPTVWIKPINTTSNNTDCTLWSNNSTALCYDCQSCKGGLLDNIKRDWKKVAIVNLTVLVFLIVVYVVGCCAI